MEIKTLNEYLNVSEMIRRLKNEFGPRFISMALFGSLAREEFDTFNDIDLFMVINGVPMHPLERRRKVAETLHSCCKHRLSLMIVTQAEFEKDFTSLYLELGIDARILYDTNDYLADKFHRIRDIIKEAGLMRTRKDRDFEWNWDMDPCFSWEITWEGLHELAR